MSTALIGLGGNLGDVLACFRMALAELAALPGTRIDAISRAYRTRAMMADPSQPRGPDYWNAAVRLTTQLSPTELLAELQRIESTAGRVRRARWEARPLDLDLLFVDDLVNFDTRLTLPHPEVASRLFVLAPLADIAPDWPIAGRTVRAALADHDAGALLEVRERWAYA